ncbi:MAG: hypothetical protein AAGE01_07200 [Pseudomonadota bacterium]
MGRYWLTVLALIVGVANAHDWKSLGPYIGSVNDITFDPTAPATVYAGTAGAGVWRSDDGGDTWRFAGNGLGGATVTWVTIDPADASRLYAGATVNRRPGLWRSDRKLPRTVDHS